MPIGVEHLHSIDSMRERKKEEKTDMLGLQILLLFWLLIVSTMMLRGIADTLRILYSLHWLNRTNNFAGKRILPSERTPYMAVFIPVLREQRVIRQTMQFFAMLHYPLEKFNVFIITTEKEIAQREQAEKKLAVFARDIASARLSSIQLIEKYLGIFSEDVLTDVITEARKLCNQTEILEFLQQTFDAYPTTIDVVKEQVNILNTQLNYPLFVHVHYPQTVGGANHQYNYAHAQLPLFLSERDISPSDAYVAVYNADSRPALTTLCCVSEICTEYFQQHRVYPPALQQAAVYNDNFDALKPNFRGLFLQSSAIYQLRWVLSHEILWRLRQSRSAHKYQQGKLHLFQRCTGAEYSLCVAHGFFLRYDLAASLDIFGADIVGDDILWSFSLCAKHIPILPIPVLESAECATTIRELTKQKRTWFMGYTEYPQNQRLVRKKIQANPVTSTLLTIHAILDAVIWLLDSPMLFLAFVLPLLLHSWFLILLTIIAYVIYGLAPHGMIVAKLKMLRSLCEGKWRLPSKLHCLGILFLTLPVLLHHSIGPWWCLMKRVRWAITGTKAYGEKTER